MRCGYGVRDEVSPLVSVLLHRPGEELLASVDPASVCMLEPLADAYRQSGVEVHYLEPGLAPPPNTMYLADLFFMTPRGAILSRPAMAVRRGEERLAADGLDRLGIPVLGSVSGNGTFEGADAAWISKDRVLLGRSQRTNQKGADQVRGFLTRLGVEVIAVDLPAEVMHLMGVLRFVGEKLALSWPGRLPHEAVEALKDAGFEVIIPPDEGELDEMSMNLVALGPKRVLMPAGRPRTRRFLEEAGVHCRAVVVDELIKGAGGIGCLTGVLKRRGG
jgi:N-dimethylarginine dimethylaminohydrolase